MVLAAWALAACGDNLGLNDGGLTRPDTLRRDSTIVDPDADMIGVLDAAVDASPDVISPSVLSVTPANATSGVWLHDVFVVTFSEPIAAATVTTQSIRLVDSANQDLTGTVTSRAMG